jgi:hypothetical protein
VTQIGANSTPATLQAYLSQVGDKPLNAQQFEEAKTIALQDKKLDRDEAKLLMDRLATNGFEPAVIPSVTHLVANGFQSVEHRTPPAYIGRSQLTNIHEVDSSFTLETAKSITDKNGIDEVYFKDDKGKLYVAYGSQETRGAINLDGVKVNYVGRFGDKKVTVVHLNNETNTTWEGVKAPWSNTLDTMRTAGQSGVVKGISEMATALTAMFIGKTVLDNGIKAVASKPAEQVAAQVLTTGATTVAPVAAEAVGRALPPALEGAKQFGSSIGQTIKSSLKTVAAGAAVAGVVVGTVVVVGSGVGAVKSRLNTRDYTTIDMVTGKF